MAKKKVAKKKVAKRKIAKKKVAKKKVAKRKIDFKCTAKRASKIAITGKRMGGGTNSTGPRKK